MGESEIFEVLRASLWAGVLMGLPILGEMKKPLS